MSIFEHSNVSLPNSYIKAPGFLLKDKKDPYEDRTKQKRLQDLLISFKSKMEASNFPNGSFSNLSTLSTDRTIRKASKESLTNFLNSHCSDAIVSPGKMKTFIDKTADLLQTAKEILALYDIELFVENFKNPSEVMKLLKSLIMEICLFPINFFRKLQIKQLKICHKEVSASPKQGIYFSAYILDTEEKPRKKLFKIIFDHLLVANPEIIKAWREIQFDQEYQYASALGPDLEEIFTALMNNTNHTLLKAPMKKLKELLAVHFPEFFSEEQFNNRTREKKKIYKVRFDD